MNLAQNADIHPMTSKKICKFYETNSQNLQIYLMRLLQRLKKPLRYKVTPFGAMTDFERKTLNRQPFYLNLFMALRLLRSLQLIGAYTFRLKLWSFGFYL